MSALFCALCCYRMAAACGEQVHLRVKANKVGETAFCQITLDTCCYSETSIDTRLCSPCSAVVFDMHNIRGIRN